MNKVCYWCDKDMGEREGHYEEGVFFSLCDDCAHKLKLEDRLPDLLRALADLRKKNQTPSFLIGTGQEN